ncbi:MAG: tetraacyldisaccharide 4'-kinase [Candidatus Solibacter sp.]|nr:tetraacyldisaccharide 4'-kinase [Candidatus Solibacter sp.]
MAFPGRKASAASRESPAIEVILNEATQALTRTITYLLYRLLQALAFPLLLLYLVRRILKNRHYARRLGERFGLVPPGIKPTLPGPVWLHAVSVGEVIAAIPLIRALRTALPGTPVYVSASTLAGRAMADQKLTGLADGVFYAPLDYCFAVRRVLRRLRPALLIIMETEIWPNMMREAKRSGAGVIIVNARISDKALPRYRRHAWFFRHPLACADAVLAQDETAAGRYRMLGAPVVEVAGNLKYDFDPATARVAPDLEAWIKSSQAGQILIAASTMPPACDGDVDEDDLIIAQWPSLAAAHPDLLLILVPRRPERFASAAAKLEGAGIAFARRTALSGPSRVLLLDTIGELNGLFRFATLVFMGGTLAGRGGHNILEPAAFGVPVACGPHMENFAEIAAEFDAAGALPGLDQTNWCFAISSLLKQPGQLTAIGKTSLELANSKRGATARSIQRIRQAYDAALPRPIPPVALVPLTWLWRAGMAADRTFKRINTYVPRMPVVSVGNLALGGAGKTPLIIWLCRELSQRGLKPAVLTRGYRRSAGKAIEIFLPCSTPDVARAGEEACLILQRGSAAVAVGADRRKSLTELQKQFHPDIILLDDGFQHWPLRRTADIVLIDALDPFRGGVLPLGRSREPFSSLRRATAIVITRTSPNREYSGLLAEIRRHNPSAPIFRARTVGHPPDLGASSFGAFCGLGQPEAFRNTLNELGLSPDFLEAFPDHHHYTESEIARLKSRAPLLLTTEKDLLNVPHAARAGIHAISIDLELDDPAGLLAALNPPATRGSA